MLRHTRMADAISFEQAAIDKCVLGVDVKNPRAEFVDVLDRINELADEMAGVPFDAQIVRAAVVKEFFPDGGLPQHIVMHDREVIRALRTMLEGDAHTMIG